MTKKEDEITSFFADQSNLSAQDFPIGIGDDMAQVSLSGGASVLITTDMLLDGVHFDSKTATLKQIGGKVMAVSLSDCAAMATKPIAAVVAVGLPREFSSAKLKELHYGIVSTGEKFGCELIGGDITRWKSDGKLAISAAMLSKPALNNPIRRNTAKVNDLICVTGSLGGSLFGKHLTFVPRVNEAIKIAGLAELDSMIDISDGLSTDLNRICNQSKVGAIIEAGKIPISEDAKKTKDPLSSALNDGEDFELLFTLSKENFEKLISQWNGSLSITNIGTITETKKLQIKQLNGETEELIPGGYDHLSH